MASIEIKNNGIGTPLSSGNLTIKNGLPIDATLQTVSDVAGNDSVLNISTASVGIGTTTATGLLNLYKAASAVRLMINGDAAQNRLITYRTGGVQRIGLYLNNTAETGSNAGSDFAIRRYTDAGALGGTPLFIKRSTGNVGINTLTPATTLDINGTANIAERLTIEADSTATTQSTAVIQNTTVNSGIALVPNGTGAITAQIPDGLVAGGNARGTNAVDLQLSRINSNQIAGGTNSAILGGVNNRVPGFSNSVIIGGNTNFANGSNNFIGGGENNITGGSNSAILGGSSNTASNGGVALGQLSTSSAFLGMALGRSAIASGDYSTSIGFSNNASNTYSFAMGRSGISYLMSQFSIGQQNSFGAPFSGLCQASFLVANKIDTLASSATTVLSLDGTGTTNLIIPEGSNRMWNVKVSTIAVVTTITGTATGVSVGDSFMENRNLLFKKVAGTSSIVGVGVVEIISDTSMSTALMTYTAGASQELALTFNGATFAGGGSLTMRIVSKVELVEVAY